jgi:hypothetical protein
MDMHINHSLCVVNQRLFLLHLLRKRGLSGKAREIIFQALIISRLSYVIPAFADFLSCLHVAQSFRWHIIDRIFYTETLISDAQFRFFKRFKDNT